MRRQPIAKIYKELLKHNTEKLPNLTETSEQKFWNRQLTKKDIQMGNRHMKRNSASFLNRELKLKQEDATMQLLE